MQKLRKTLRKIDKAHVSNYIKIARAEYDPILDDYITPIYYYKDIRFDFEFPYKFEIAQPYLHLTIPIERFGLASADTYDFESTISIEDFILRSIEPLVAKANGEYYNKNKEVKETGAVYAQQPTQEMIKRNSVQIKGDFISILLKTVLPVHHNGTINGKKASTILTKDIPEVLDRFISGFDSEACRRWVETAKIQSAIRSFIRNRGLVSFIADGSILPRNKGTDLLLDGAVPFVSTKEDAIEITVGDRVIRGMGIRKGITVITGGGYSGKSTLLDAIECGVYNHVPGDGREFVITDATAVKVYAEDGRPVSDLDLSPFIRYLPMGGNPSQFSTEHASGSTSQAANIIEAINAGAKALLIDEDKSATNFMIRDKLMKQIVKNDPIIPFTDRAREIYEALGVSTILVIGGSSEYFNIADTVLLIEDYLPYNIDAHVKSIFADPSSDNAVEPALWDNRRYLSFRKQSMFEQLAISRLEISGRKYVAVSDETIDITLLTAISSKAQAASLAQMLRYVMSTVESMALTDIVDTVFKKVHSEGLDSICSSSFAMDRWLDMPRPNELHALLCRVRNAVITKNIP